jgi:hypothetical protein
MPDLYLATDHSAGDECSSTYEGRHITIEESLITHPTHADGFVDGGDPVVIGGANGELVGVAFRSAAAATDYIAIDTEGIWFLSVVGSDDSGNSAVDEGDLIYINTSTCVLSKIANWATQLPFGRALGDLTGGTTGVVAVKVHCDPKCFNAVDNFVACTSGDYAWSIKSTLAGGASEGLNGYVDGTLTAVTTGHLYGFGSWINGTGVGVFAAGHIIVPFEGGVYSGDAQAAGRVVFAGQHQCILPSAPASLHAWRLNVAQVAGNVTALIAAANPESVGYVTSAATASTKVGAIPIADIVSKGIVWIRCYDSAV